MKTYQTADAERLESKLEEMGMLNLPGPHFDPSDERLAALYDSLSQKKQGIKQVSKLLDNGLEAAQNIGDYIFDLTMSAPERTVTILRGHIGPLWRSLVTINRLGFRYVSTTPQKLSADSIATFEWHQGTRYESEQWDMALQVAQDLVATQMYETFAISGQFANTHPAQFLKSRRTFNDDFKNLMVGIEYTSLGPMWRPKMEQMAIHEIISFMKEYEPNGGILYLTDEAEATILSRLRAGTCNSLIANSLFEFSKETNIDVMIADYSPRDRGQRPSPLFLNSAAAA